MRQFIFIIASFCSILGFTQTVDYNHIFTKGRRIYNPILLGNDSLLAMWDCSISSPQLSSNISIPAIFQGNGYSTKMFNLVDTLDSPSSGWLSQTNKGEFIYRTRKIANFLSPNQYSYFDYYLYSENLNNSIWMRSEDNGYFANKIIERCISTSNGRFFWAGFDGHDLYLAKTDSVSSIINDLVITENDTWNTSYIMSLMVLDANKLVLNLRRQEFSSQTIKSQILVIDTSLTIVDTLYDSQNENFFIYKTKALKDGFLLCLEFENQQMYLRKRDQNLGLLWSTALPYLGYESTLYPTDIAELDDGSLIHHYYNDVRRYYPTGEEVEFHICLQDSLLNYDMTMVSLSEAFEMSVALSGDIKTDYGSIDDTIYGVIEKLSFVPYNCDTVFLDASFTGGTNFLDLNSSNGEITFSNFSPEALTWQWDFGDGTIQWSEDTVTHNFVYNGLHRVELIVGHGACTDTSSILIEVVNGINHINENGQGEIKIYPNPSNSYLRLESAYRLKKLKLVNLNGRIVLCEELNGESLVELCTSDLASGYYNLIVYGEGGSEQTFKILVSH